MFKTLALQEADELFSKGRQTISYSGLICNCSPNVAFEEGDDEEEDDGSNCK